MTVRGPKQLSRFALLFEKREDNQCWNWFGGKSTKGYGRFDNEQAHRFAYRNYVSADFSAKDLILHRCHNKGCVNPKHLYIGTAQDNADYAWQTRECKLGKNHKLTHRDICQIKEIWENAEIVDPRRNRRSPSQKEIAAEFGVTQAAISAILSGKNGVGICKGDTGFTVRDWACRQAH